jgi:hypothetical protein
MGCASPACPLIKIRLAKGQTLGPPSVIRPSRDETAAVTQELGMVKAEDFSKVHQLLDSVQRLVTRLKSMETRSKG